MTSVMNSDTTILFVKYNFKNVKSTFVFIVFVFVILHNSNLKTLVLLVCLAGVQV